MKKKVLITGCTGMTGSHMIDYLLENTDHDIYALVRRQSNPNFKNIKHILNNPRVKIVSGDLNDYTTISKLVSDLQPDYFINLAAQSHVHESWNTPYYTFQTNAVGTLNCLEAIRLHAPNCRFYQASTSEMWGDVLESPQNENTVFRPRSPYGAAKCASHYLVKVYRESYNLYAVCGILLNHESERRSEDFVTRKITKGVAKIKRALDKGEKPEPLVLGNLDAKRDWSYAPDFVDGIWRILNQEQYIEELREKQHSSASILIPANIENEKGKVLSKYVKDYVLASGETHSVRKFVELAFEYTGIELIKIDNQNLTPISNKNALQVNYTLKNGYPIVVVSKDFYRPADVELLLGDASLAKKELGWIPKVSFENLVNKMMKHDLEHEQ